MLKKDELLVALIGFSFALLVIAGQAYTIINCKAKGGKAFMAPIGKTLLWRCSK